MFFVTPEDDSEIDEPTSLESSYRFLEDEDSVSIKKPAPKTTSNGNDNESVSSSVRREKKNSISSDAQSVASNHHDNTVERKSLINKLDKLSNALESK